MEMKQMILLKRHSPISTALTFGEVELVGELIAQVLLKWFIRSME